MYVLLIVQFTNVSL